MGVSSPGAASRWLPFLQEDSFLMLVDFCHIASCEIFSLKYTYTVYTKVFTLTLYVISLRSKLCPCLCERTLKPTVFLIKPGKPT